MTLCSHIIPGFQIAAMLVAAWFAGSGVVRLVIGQQRQAIESLGVASLLVAAAFVAVVAECK